MCLFSTQTLLAFTVKYIFFKGSNIMHSNKLADKLAKFFKDSNKDKDDLLLRLKSEGKTLRNLISKPLSIYFSAYRSDDYEEGGEAYLTFDSKYITTLGQIARRP